MYLLVCSITSIESLSLEEDTVPGAPSAQRPQTGQTAAGGGAESSFGGRSAQASANRAPGGVGTAERKRDPHTRARNPGAASAQRPQTGQTAAGGGAEFSFGGRSA
jgi:hypothetical protein